MSLLALAALLGMASTAQGRSRGIEASGCDGCHSGGDSASISFSDPALTPGDTATLNFTVNDPGGKEAGIYVALPDTSRFSAGSNLAVVSGGISHTSPKAMSGGAATFSIEWQVPTGQGAEQFAVSAVAANANGSNSGDASAFRVFEVVYGCDPQSYYRDIDSDGYGDGDYTRLGCAGAVPDGYAAKAGDCDDYRDSVYPDATEYCNRRDDDCDEVVDEDALPVALYPDSDGDGFSTSDERSSGEVVMGCLPYDGYAAESGDCDGENPNVHPEAEELCNLFYDDDCDGRVDERVRPLCGEGWCRRESPTCDLADCQPGEPIEERCNFFDDDCDGEVDEGDICPDGQLCLAGECRAGESEAVTNDPTPGDDPQGAGTDQEPDDGAAGCGYDGRRAPLGKFATCLALVGAALVLRRRQKAWRS